jgi:hypothetical protein
MFSINEIITYILSFFIASIQKDIELQQKYNKEIKHELDDFFFTPFRISNAENISPFSFAPLNKTPPNVGVSNQKK